MKARLGGVAGILQTYAQLAQASGQITTSLSSAERAILSLPYDTQTLLVSSPKLYHIQGEEIAHYDAAYNGNSTANVCDIIGRKPNDTTFTTTKKILMLSPSQRQADLLDEHDAYLLPLIHKVYQETALWPYAVREALIGSLSVEQGNLQEPFKLSVSFETPSHAVSKYRQFDTLLKRIQKNQRELADRTLIRELEGITNELYLTQGELGRYNVVPQTISQDATEIKTDFGYGLYLPDLKQKLYVTPSPQVLLQLINVGFYKPSLSVLEKNIERFLHASDKEFHTKLTRLAAHFKYTPNDDFKKDALKTHPELAPFSIVPYYDCPTLYAIIDECSDFEIVRLYANSNKFKEVFNEHSDSQKADLLRKLNQFIPFIAHQNNDTNLFLSTQQIAKDIGLEFKISKR
jgi:hypothetical protein